MHNVHIDHSRSVINERLLKIKNKILVISNKGGVGKIPNISFKTITWPSQNLPLPIPIVVGI